MADVQPGVAQAALLFIYFIKHRCYNKLFLDYQ